MQTLYTPVAVAEWLHQQLPAATDLRCDSRHLQKGEGFVAWPGAATDGRRYVTAALQAGAAVALVEREGVEAFDLVGDRIAAISGLKTQAGPVASAYYGNPSAELDVVAITGTNGKTSCAWWIAQLLSALQRPCALVGTLGMGQVGFALESTGLTTPDPVMLQRRLRRFVQEGVRACAIEASSIGMVEGRLNATQVKVAVFTNFTQDHLDFHGTMADYWAAKAQLFDWPGLEAAVVNVDDPEGAALAQTLALREVDLWTVAIEDGASESSARLAARDLAFTDTGMRLSLAERGASEVHSLQLPLVGRYNVSNLLCVLASARALGFPLPDAVQACASLTAVPGRMQQVVAAQPNQPLVLVDYAHTPDALEKALHALQPLAKQRGGKLWVVVGCGGDRDAGKRPLMAATCEREAQRVLLTSDNPRSEDPQSILQQMLAGMTRPDAAQVEPDRALAIALAVRDADAADVVLVAGKGHEDYQEVQGVQKPFSDAIEVQAAFALRAKRTGLQGVTS